MNTTEQAVMFACQRQNLLGIVTVPASPQPLGVVIVVGGPQYRVGSHRQFTLLARAAASHGFAVLRFDYRGMGDSEGEVRSFEDVNADVGAAIAALLQTCPTVRQVVLCGLCDGASAALLYLDQPQQDPRVVGLCLLNPWVRSAATLAQTQVKHYYLDRLRQAEFWTKLLRGQVAGQAIWGLLRNLVLMFRGTVGDRERTQVAQPYTHRMARSWGRYAGRILLFLSELDYTAKEFMQAWRVDADWQSAAQHARLERVDLAGADHTLSSEASRCAMETGLLRWLKSWDTGSSADWRGPGTAPDAAEKRHAS